MKSIEGRRGFAGLAGLPAFGMGVCALVLALCGFAMGCSTAEQSDPSSAKTAGADGDAETAITAVTGDEWAAYLPKIEVKEDGTMVQKTPYGGTTWGYMFPEGSLYYNTFVLNADQRGCTSCHNLADVLTKGNLKHWLYEGRYEAEGLTAGDCVACHAGLWVDWTDYIHAHMSYSSFVNMGGTCMSCHYVTSDGTYYLWDDVKYDVLHGITDVAADDVQASISWDQDEITPLDKMYVSTGHVEMDYKYDYVEVSDTIRDEYTVSFAGDMDHPCEMTIQEMIDRFGSETRVVCNHCTAVGTGGSLIYQAEVTGIPLAAIVESLGLHDDANLFEAIGLDEYYIPLYTAKALASNALLVYEMNGEPLTPEQGYPLAIYFFDGMSGGMYSRFLSEIHIYHSDEEPSEYLHYFEGAYGEYINPKTGERINTPNIGVLTAESGTIFSAGQPIHLEGYAHAFDETIVKMEFSFDRGQTWIEVPCEDVDNVRWVYWKMDISNFTEPGAYVLQLRATCVNDEGVESTNATIPAFLINVQ